MAVSAVSIIATLRLIVDLFPPHLRLRIYLRHAGFDVISFDGPRQGAAIEPFAITASDGDQCRCTHRKRRSRRRARARGRTREWDLSE